MENKGNNHTFKTLQSLEKKGYKDQLMLDKSELVNLTSKKRYLPEQVIDCREYRFEGMSNPSDLSLLFALEFSDHSKGTISAAYGPKGDVDLYEFMGKIDKCNIRHINKA